MTRSLPQYLRSSALLVFGALLLACDTGVDPDLGPTQIRFVNAVPAIPAPFQFTLEGGPAAQLQPGEQSAYFEAAPRVFALRVRDQDSTWSIAGNLEILGGLYQTLIAFGPADESGAVLVGDEPGRANEGAFLVRILHVAPDVEPALDVHLLGVGEPVDPAGAAVTGMNYPSARDHFNVTAGVWRIVLAASGGSEIVFDSGAITFSAREVHTVVISNMDDGSPRLIRLRDGV